MQPIQSPPPDAPAAPAALSWEGYQPLANCVDEMLGADGGARAHWAHFLRELDALGLEELQQRWTDARQLIHENGLTYNIHGDPHGLDRPWKLDPIPVLISPAEGKFLETGLIQWARVLELLLADIYGPQKLLSQGLLPPELIFANPHFLRPCHGIPVAGHRRLSLLAVDLGRGPDGAFRVISQRTEAPFGAGYALENRIVLSRMLPDLFRDCQVHRLALFFQTLRETLRSLAPHNKDNPRVVLLSTGPQSEAYFGHAFLARYLGYTLVEGADLTVRDNRVFLKLLGGLQPVDVILRRVPADQCDPLELRGDSLLGVPGLVQAVRTGNVGVANSIGSGLIESPALQAFLPNLCQHLLGEPLKIPSVPTWWCGDPVSLQYVLEHLPNLVIKPTFPQPRYQPIFAERLTSEQQAELSERLRARPLDYVAQEQLALSTVPILNADRLEPRHLVLRTFLTAYGDAFAVMPGGLTRATPTPHSLELSPQTSVSKDTWVLSDAPVNTFSLLRPSPQQVELSRGGGDLPSRAADNLFWLGRYATRAEVFVRLVRVILVRMTESSGLREAPELPVLLRTLPLPPTSPAFTAASMEDRLAVSEAELFQLIFDHNRVGSLAATIRGLYQVASMTRDRMSTDMWRIVTSIDLTDLSTHHSPTLRNGEVSEYDRRHTLSAVLDLLSRIVLTLAAFGGLASESMSRGQGWRFLDMGRRLEQATHAVTLLRTLLNKAIQPEGPVLEAVLEIFDSSMTYRRRYLSGPQAAAVLDLLLVDETNPRSLASQLVHLNDHVERLPHNEADPRLTPEQRLMLSSLTTLRLADITALARVAADSGRPQLEKFLAQYDADLSGLSDAITHSYLSHLKPSRQTSRG